MAAVREVEIGGVAAEIMAEALRFWVEMQTQKDPRFNPLVCWLVERVIVVIDGRPVLCLDEDDRDIVGIVILRSINEGVARLAVRISYRVEEFDDGPILSRQLEVKEV